MLIPAVLGFLAAPALARHNFSMLKVNPELGVAGAEVAVSGFSYPVTAKVSIRFNALDGPVLGELEPTANQDIGGTVRIPEGTASGRYLLYAVQYGADGKPNRIPGRGALTVVGPGGAPPPTTPIGLELEDRPRALATSAGPGGAPLVLVGLGALAIAGLLTLGVARLPVSRRPGAEAGGETS
ncbi:MAG TPA: hypothetical protein VGV86_14065 [Acidimicrobiales bacterium]|nr:hypothetical protein [Acidimicrobiales bacterium]